MTTDENQIQDKENTENPLAENYPNEKQNEELNEAQKKLKRKNEIIRIIKFVLLSASAGVIQLVSFTILNELAFRGTETGVGYWVPYLISLILSVIWNFTFNRKFTFKSAANVPKAMLLVLAYYVVFTPLSTLWGDALTDKAVWNEYAVLIMTMVINLVTEFLYNRFVVYRKSLNTNDLGKKEEAAVQAAGENGSSATPESDEHESDNENVG